MLPSTATHSYSYHSSSAVHLSAWWLYTHTHLIIFSVSVFTQIHISEVKLNWAFEWIDWLKVWKNNCQLKLLTKHKDIHSHTDIMQIPVTSLGTILSLLCSVRNSQY